MIRLFKNIKYLGSDAVKCSVGPYDEEVGYKWNFYGQCKLAGYFIEITGCYIGLCKADCLSRQFLLLPVSEGNYCSCVAATSHSVTRVGYEQNLVGSPMTR